MSREKHHRNVRHSANAEDLAIPSETFESMWRLFVEIGRFWRNMSDPSPHRSALLTFMNNRIKVDPSYLHEYESAKDVIEQLIYEHGEERAYEFLFTDPTASYSPPQTRLARTRQRVSNEFIAFQLSVGGFKEWGAKNWPGYIGGANIKGQTPYRTAKDD